MLPKDCLKLVSVKSESLSWSGSKLRTVGPVTGNARWSGVHCCAVLLLYCGSGLLLNLMTFEVPVS